MWVYGAVVVVGKGQWAVGMVVVDVSLFDYFLMGLQLGLQVFFGWFVPIEDYFFAPRGTTSLATYATSTYY